MEGKLTDGMVNEAMKKANDMGVDVDEFEMTLILAAAFRALPSQSVERIVSAAARIGGLTITLPPPNRHHNIFRGLDELGVDFLVPPYDQGFLTSKGRFVGRKEALAIAKLSEQVSTTEHGEELFSEDLW